MVKNKFSVKTVVIWFFLWLIITQSLSWLMFNRLRITEPDKLNNHDDQTFKPHPLNFLETHARQDSAWYFSIVYQGYQYSKTSQSNVNFFPLYPLLMKAGYNLLEPFTPNLTLYYRYLISGTLISIISLFLALIVLFKLFRLDVNSETAFLAIFFVTIFPTSYFFTSLYTESLFLLLSVLCFYMLRKQKFLLAGMAGFLASLTRPVGIFLVVPFLIELMQNQKNKNLKQSIINSVSLLLIPFGLFLFMNYLQNNFGNPLLFIEAQMSWGRQFNITTISNIFNSLYSYIATQFSFNHASSANILIEISFLVFGILSSYLVLKYERTSYAIWVLLLLIFPLISEVIMSQPRFDLVLFPIFLPLARISSKNVLFKQSYIVVSLFLFSFFSILFINGYWSY